MNLTNLSLFRLNAYNLGKNTGGDYEKIGRPEWPAFQTKHTPNAN